MGAITGLVGAGGGVNGTGIAGPSAAPILSGTNAQQIQQAYQGAQGSLGQQQALLQALQGQNGLGNQSQVYGQLQGIAAGTGPNPAAAMLNQATGQNVANQAALMAGQRGAASNVGLMARQAAQQGAATQQQAVGQGATMQAQQALGAIGAAGNMANTQAGQQIAGTTANTQAQQSEQQILQNSLAAQNQANVAMQSNINNANAGLAGTVMKGQQAVIGGVLGGAGAALGLAEGGQVPIKMADGGFTQGWAGASPGTAQGPLSSMGQFMNGIPPTTGGRSIQSGMKALGSGIGKAIHRSSTKGYIQDNTPGAIAGAGNNYATEANNFGAAPSASDPGAASNFGVAPLSSPQMGSDMNVGLSAPSLSEGGAVGNKLKKGGHVPGKAKVKGNSYSNDTVPALLSPGEGVIDRETMNDGGPVGDAARLLMTIVNAKKGKK